MLCYYFEIGIVLSNSSIVASYYPPALLFFFRMASRSSIHVEIVFEGTKITVLEVDRASFSKAALERQITDIIEIASGSLVGQKLSFLFEKQISADAHLFYDINQGTPESLPVAL